MPSGKIGLLLKKSESVFSNGCVQQPLFLKKTLLAAGFEVVFLGIEADYTVFEQTQEPVVLTTPSTDFSSFDCVMLASVVLLENPNNLPYIRNLEKYGVMVVNFVCGNIFVLHQEEFVFGKHSIMHHYMQKYYHTNLIMEMYDYARDYLRMMSGIPTHICPYVWDPDIIESYVGKNRLCEHMGDDRDKLNVAVFEANMSIHKNALVPILICEEYYRRWPDRLNTVYLFCSDSVMGSNKVLFERMSIFRDKKVEVYGRIVMPYIMDAISKSNAYVTTCLSYTMMNRLNFLHLEMMYLGIPIVHNCAPFDNGYHFDDFEYMRAVDLLEKVRTAFDRDAYRAKCAPILREYASDNPARVAGYKKLLNDVIAMKRRAPRADPPRADPPRADPPRFLRGDGYVIAVTSDSPVTDLCATIREGGWKPDRPIEIVGDEPTSTNVRALLALEDVVCIRHVNHITFKNYKTLSWDTFVRNPKDGGEWFT